MILIEFNRWSIRKMEEAIKKYNEENKYGVYEYVDLINVLLGKFLIQKKSNSEKKR